MKVSFPRLVTEKISTHTTSLPPNHRQCQNSLKEVNFYQTLSEFAERGAGAFKKRAPDWGRRVVFLAKTLKSHSESLHPGV